MSNIIEISHVNFAYDISGPILDDVSFTIKNGQSGCIVGPNGGGKSTLLKLFLGLLKPDSGMIKVFGTSPETARISIGYMPQYHQLDSAFPITALEVALMGRMHSKMFGYFRKTDRIAAMNALEELGISSLANTNFASLSGGLRQRVLIARALAGNPKLLLLDEPTANIDPGAEEQFYTTLDTLRKRMTVLTVSHDLGFVSREIDFIICVNRKVVIHEAAKFTAETANNIYHHQVNMVKHNHSCFCHCEHNARGEK